MSGTSSRSPRSAAARPSARAGSRRSSASRSARWPGGRASSTPLAGPRLLSRSHGGRGYASGHALILGQRRPWGSAQARRHASGCAEDALSSAEPSRGTSPALVTRFGEGGERDVRDASRICSSSQPASRASSWRCIVGGPSLSSSAADVAEQAPPRARRRVELAGERDLVEAEPGLARGALEHREPVLASWCWATASAIRCWVLSGSEPWRSSSGSARSARRRRRRAGQDAEEVRELPAPAEGALQDRKAALRRGQLVVDLEPALLGLHRLHFLRSVWGSRPAFVLTRST